MRTPRATIRAACLVLLLLPLVVNGQTPQADDLPAFTVYVQVWGDGSDFALRIQDYFDRRLRLQGGLPPVTVTADVRQIRKATRLLARAIRAERPGAVQGEFFTPATSAAFRSVLARIMTPRVWAVIMDDNPGSFRHAIDGDYPEGKTRATTPGIVLRHLPRLPEGIEFRFVGRHLILYDVRANTIVDRLPDAIVCAGCWSRGR